MQSKKIIIIGGPTACGKSTIAFQIAKKINGEIISADSRQFYQEINIGTDKSPLWMREEIPHHMVDICLLYTSPSPRDLSTSRMPSSA